MRPTEELLYDSEASLRLVDHAIEELSASGAELDRDARGFLDHVLTQPGGFTELSRTLLRAYAETVGIVNRIRETCGILDGAGIDKLEQMHGRLREVSSATEMAANDILDGLTRVVTLVEELDVVGELSDADRHRMLATAREELSGVMNHLQFQDITSQQLAHIASLLSDMRQRTNQIVGIFAPQMASFAKDESSAVPLVAPKRTVYVTHEPATGPFDPNATTEPSDGRQAVADEIFAVRTDRKSA